MINFFIISGRDIDLDYCDMEWLALETNRDHSVTSEAAPKYCISNSFLDYEGYFISSKGFLPTVVDIWSSELNSPIPVHFSALIPKMPMLILNHLLFKHVQFTLIHGPNFRGSYAILFFTASDFAFITRHIHN